VLNRVDGGDDVYWKSERLTRAAAEDAQHQGTASTDRD
jgi:cob(I)alamin adenosyltransferase